ncbi:hypothetical protein UFOVP1261_18 [uncultured Caudovirales phage]|uniref:Uncharacterized protein n=1 Tax=uncultured Caudovirales phage TaxID=2100421 RepID=A0A6J5T537_9CAUD|nr:hypothetical protein UFOVP1261_18 [uncultured Caudovirales phage]CAB4221954.1 hypothetical protein UFOVP1650_6 [uncultured Caudovirales phage]
MNSLDRLIALIVAIVGLLVIYSTFRVPVVPAEMMCIDSNGYYRPTSGLNYVVINDERCK